MSTKKSIFFICFLLVILTIWRMPASLVARFLESNSHIPITILNTSGTLWDGSGRIRNNTIREVNISWSIPFFDILLLSPSVIWKLDNSDSVLQGKSSISDKKITTVLSGTIGSVFLNRIFTEYDVRLDGSLSVEGISVVTDLSKSFLISQLDGLAIWSGGEVTYMLAKLPVTIMSPVFELELFNKTPSIIDARINSPGYSFPLLLASLTERGNLSVKVTKAFTEIFGNKWPGQESEENIVLELEEYIF